MFISIAREVEDVTSIDDLVERYKNLGLSRRELFIRATVLGLTGTSLAAFLAACGGDDDDDDEGDSPGSGEDTDSDEDSDDSDEDAGGNGEPRRGGQLVFGAWQDPDTLDTHTTGLAATSRILIHIYDPLVWKVPGTNEFVPGLAEEWEVSEDGREYTFTLRQDVKFHNGQDFNAESVKFSFDRINNPETASRATSSFGPNPVTEVIDTYTVKVSFDEPFSPFLTYVGVTLSMRPISSQAVEELGEDINNHPVGTGPFMFKEYVRQDHFTMERNPDYNWGPSIWDHQDAPYLDEILWKIVPEPSTRVSALDTGEVMVIEEVRPQDIERYQAEPDNFSILQSGTPGQPRMILINTQAAPTDEVAVRRACILATDQDTIINTIYQGAFTPSHSLLDPLTPCFAEDLDGFYTYDPELAMQTLEEAGWVVGDDGIREKDGERLEILFISNSANDFRNIAELMQATYREVGIEMEITFESQPSVFSTYNDGPQNFADFFFWSPDPDQLKATYHSNNIEIGFNWSHFDNAEFDDLVERAAAESDVDARCELYHQAQVILWEEAAAIPIQQKAALIVAENRVKNIKFESNAYPYYHDTWIEE